MPIVDLADICTGKAQYGTDVRMKDTLFASIERPPTLGAEVKTYDAMSEPISEFAIFADVEPISEFGGRFMERQNYVTRMPALPEGHPFTNLFNGWYWTSTTAAINTAYAWYLHMEGARMFYGNNELESLVDCSAHDPALPDAYPFRDVREGYWSSTTSMFEPDWAWALYLNKGAVGVGQKKGAHFHVWAVCDPPSSYE